MFSEQEPQMHTPPSAGHARALAHYSAMAAEALVMQRNAGPTAGPRHTPGPWTWHGTSLRPEQAAPELSAVHTILDAEGGCGYLASNVHETLRELDADMALIAAAPELLKALQLVAHINDAAIDSADRCLQLNTAMPIIRAAIDKAVQP
jgi:hypothetical protein